MRREQHEPHVGIFWLFDGAIIIDSTPVSKAEPYADALTHPRGHDDYWTLLQQQGLVPSDVDYMQAPRGRVGYDNRDKRFYLRADRCIRKRKDIVKQIMAALHVSPEETTEEPDDHYRCAQCLELEWEQEDDLDDEI